MTTPNAGVLDTVLNTFRTQIDSGFGALRGPVHGTLGTLIVISVATMALFWAIDEGSTIWGPLLRKAFVVGFWSYMILNWQTTALAVYTAFGNLGASVGGAGGLSGFLNYPSQVVHIGITNAQILIDLAAYYCGITNNWGTPPAANLGLNLAVDLKTLLGFLVNIIEALFCALLVFIAYFWLALEIVVTTIEFHIVILMGFCLLPFGVFERTSSYAERVLGYVVSAGFKVMALGVVIGLGQTFLTNDQLTYTPGALPGLDQMAGLALGVIVVLMLAISAPKYAQAVVSGGTSTGVGSFAGAGGLAVGAGLAIAGAGKAAVGAVTGAAGGSAAAAGAVAGGAAGSSTSGAAAASMGGESGGAAPAASAEAQTSVADLAATVRPPSTNTASAPAGGADAIAQTITTPAQAASPAGRASTTQTASRAVSNLTASAQRVAADSDGAVVSPPPLRSPSDNGATS